MAVNLKPGEAVYQRALEHAELLRETDNDPSKLAHVLLYLAERNEKLQAITDAAEEYIRFGQDQHLHAQLLKAIEAFKDYEVETEEMEDPCFGLD